MKELLTTILESWHGRALVAVGLVLVLGAVYLAYKAGQMSLL